MVKKYQRFFNVMQVLLDASALCLAYACSLFVKTPWEHLVDSSGEQLIAPLWMVPLTLLVYHSMNAYTPMRSRKFGKEALILARAHFTGTFIVFSVLFLNKSLTYSRAIALCFACSGFLLLLLERYAVRRTLRYFRQKGYNQRHLLIVGAGELGKEFARKALAQGDLGYNVIGFLDDDAREHAPVLGRKVLGSCEKLPQLLATQSIDEVVVALPINAHQRYATLINACEKAGVRIRIIPDYFRFLPSSTPQIEEFDGIPLLNVRRIPLDDPFSQLLKRAFDIVVASLALLLTAPLMISISVVIKTTSPGPLLFRQRRVGLNNRPFDMLKFRTMRVDDDLTASTTWTTPNDPRTTKFGSFLRKTSLDELPQFFNVLFSDMSVIGPRPERPFFVEQFKEEVPQYMVKHQVKPGITGWAQVNGWRGDTSIKKRIECDLYYIENWKLLLDLKIVYLTLLRGMFNRNAY